ncbi:hypothetical protein MMC28_009128 [Mycoblastus sanguinarius]|nr:hypothetical protein [Mycoblastus sanguinarius]
MDERSSIPPGLPRPNPTLSYWQDPPSHLANHRTTPNLPASTSIVIIGSGVTGTSLAFNLLNQPSASSVLMLEARTACSGATGRNGGHTKHASYREFLDNMKTYGEEDAAKIVRFEYNCMKAVHTFAREHCIQCDSWEGDTVDVIYDQGQWKKAKKAVGEIRRVLGEKDPAAQYKFWDAEETEKEFLAEGSLGTVSYEAGSLSAYKFVIGMMDLAIEKGLNLQTETPALKITNHEDGQWVVNTPRGEVKAGKVLLATNGYTAHLYPKLQGVIVPLRGHMTAQRPGKRLPRDGLKTTYSFIYDDGYEYMISRPQGSRFAGDIAIGGGSTKAPDVGVREFGTTDDTTIDPIILNYVKNSTVGYFGSNWGDDHPEGRLRKAWTGIMGYSADGFPLVGQIPGEEGLYIAASFQGSGMVLCLLAAKALVSMINDEDKQELDDWFPRPFHMTHDRMKVKFRGRLKTKVTPMDLELKSQT